MLLRKSPKVLVLAAGVVFGQGGYAAGLLEEVVVTAQKREQNIQDVGIAITAFTGEQADALGWQDSEDIAAQTPGLITTSFNGDSSTSFFVVRGLGQADFGDQHEAPTVVYRDGAYLPSMGSAAVQLFDIDRVETLKGPQGTLFGRNATGGLVHILSRRPTEGFDAYGDLEISEYDTIRFEGAVGGNLTDNLQSRLSFMKHDADGFLENDLGPDLREEDAMAVRLQFLGQVSDRLEVHLALNYSEVDDISGGTYTPELLAGDTSYYSGFIPNNDPLDASVSPGGSLDKEAFQVTGTISWDVTDRITLTSITDYQDAEKTYQEDSDSSPFREAEFFSDQDLEVFAQELRLNGSTERTEWTAGIYYLNVEGEFISSFNFPDFFAFGNISTFGNNDFGLDTESWAIFAQLDYTLTDNLSLTAGIRYTEDRKDFDLTATCAPGPNPRTGVAVPVIAGFGPPFDGLNGCEAFGITGGLVGPQGSPTVVDAGRTNLSRTDKDITAKLQLDWRVNDWTLLYAGFNRGMKAGGYAPSSDAATFVEDLEYNKEVLHAYEIGMKTEFFDGRARVNAAAFYYDYRDYQAFVFAGLSNVVINQDAEVYGGEIEIIAEPAAGLSFLAGVSLLDATVKDIPGVGDQDMLLAPDVTVNLLGRKEWSLANGGAVALQVDGVYVDEQTANSVNSAGAAIDAYTVWNARATYVHSRNWEASLFVRNLADEEYYTYAFDVSGFFADNVAVRAYGPPRWIGGSIRYAWE